MQHRFRVVRILLSISIVSFLMGIGVSVAHAQTFPPPLELVTSPLPITLTATPGAAITTQLKVKNGGGQIENIVLGVMKFSSAGEEGEPKLMEQTRADDYLSWVTFSPNTFNLAPNEWKTVTATFHVPDTAAFGYYYAITFSRAIERQTEVKSGTTFQASSAVLVLLDVQSPHAKRTLEVTEFSSDKKMYEFLPATFTIRVKNTGNVHTIPRGNIFIDRGGAKDVAVIEINAEKGNILPDSSRVFRATWADGFPVVTEKVTDGHVVLDRWGKQQTTLNWDLRKADRLRWGKFHANLLLIFDDGQKDVPIEGVVEFWVFPWRLLFVALAIPTLPAGAVYMVMTMRMRKHA